MKRKENSRGPQKTLLANSCKHILFNTQSYRLDFKNSEFLLKKKKILISKNTPCYREMAC